MVKESGEDRKSRSGEGKSVKWKIGKGVEENRDNRKSKEGHAVYVHNHEFNFVKTILFRYIGTLKEGEYIAHRPL